MLERFYNAREGMLRDRAIFEELLPRSEAAMARDEEEVVAVMHRSDNQRLNVVGNGNHASELVDIPQSVEIFFVGNKMVNGNLLDLARFPVRE